MYHVTVYIETVILVYPESMDGYLDIYIIPLPPHT